MFEVKLKGNDVVDRSGAGAGGPARMRVSTTLPDGEVLVIPTADLSLQHDATSLSRRSVEPE
ncbi:hypothetical protein [Tsukamurella sp. NPDC003166]|uniref:hypothetical protein n=1 Tax=Tsukamurella sp. NPDC003166 TaxID=3154444 RepID=UPI0033B7576F